MKIKEIALGEAEVWNKAQELRIIQGPTIHTPGEDPMVAHHGNDMEISYFIARSWTYGGTRDEEVQRNFIPNYTDCGMPWSASKHTCIIVDIYIRTTWT
ncbi:unnamed protein product [Cochlearia groenlandica]